MKIGIVLASTPGYSETFFVSKIKGLQQHGFKVVLFIASASKTFNLCPVRIQPRIQGMQLIISILRSLILFLTRWKSIRQFIQLEKKDHVRFATILKKIIINQHIFRERNIDWLHFGFATQALGKENVAKAIDAKMAVSLRGFDISIYPLKHSNCYKYLWEKVDKIHVISNDLLQAAYSHGLQKYTSYQKITPAIDVNLFTKKRNNLNDKNIHRFITVGRLNWKKGYPDTLKALQLLKLKGIPFSYTIVGDGDDYERIAYIAYDLGLSDCVRFMGKISPDEVKDLLEESTIYIQYSIQEGFCNAALEAQAMGLAVIVSDAEGLPENVLHEQTGWVVPKNNPEKLVEKIEEVISLSHQKLQEIRKNAITRVQKEFTIEKQAKEFARFYRS